MTVASSTCPRCHRELIVVDRDDLEDMPVERTSLDPAQLDIATAAALVVAAIDVWLIWRTKAGTVGAALAHPWLRRSVSGATRHARHSCASAMPGQRVDLARRRHAVADECPF